MKYPKVSFAISPCRTIKFNDQQSNNTEKGPVYAKNSTEKRDMHTLQTQYRRETCTHYKLNIEERHVYTTNSTEKRDMHTLQTQHRRETCIYYKLNREERHVYTTNSTEKRDMYTLHVQKNSY